MSETPTGENKKTKWILMPAESPHLEVTVHEDAQLDPKLRHALDKFVDEMRSHCGGGVRLLGPGSFCEGGISLIR